MTDEVRNYIDEAANKNILEDDEYIDSEDGLIHCSVCCERRQTVVKRFRHPGYFIPRCPCSCQIEEERQRKEKQAQRERMERIKRRRAHGLRDALRFLRFEVDFWNKWSASDKPAHSSG